MRKRKPQYPHRIRNSATSENLEKICTLMATYILAAIIMTYKSSSLIFGVILLALGLLALFDNPIIGDSNNAFFKADSINGLMNIVCGTLLLVVGLIMPDFARSFLTLFGIFFFILGIMGLSETGTVDKQMAFGLLHLNSAHTILHITLGIVIFMTALKRRKVRDF